MTEENAHIRLDKVEARLAAFEVNLRENTKLTETIATNTAELVTLVRGVKGSRALLVWASPVILLVLAVIAYFKHTPGS